MRKLLTLAALLSFILPDCLKAQYQATGGREFWVTFIENYTEDSVNADYETILTISSDAVAQVEISIPGIGWSQNVVVAAAIPSIVYLPRNSVTTDIPEQKQERGVRIQADKDVVVVASNQRPASTDATLVLPAPALGEEYFVLSYGEYNPDYTNLMASSFVIVASENSTQVRITPAAPTWGGRPAGVPFQVFLQKGETYLVRAVDGNYDLSGSRIQVIPNGTAPKPIAVYAGAQCSNVGGCRACDALYEQLWPQKRLGREYLFVPFKTRLGDLVRILAMEPGTQVNIGSTTIELNAGDWIDTVLLDPMTIAADKPIQVAQLSRGAQCDSLPTSGGDPFLLMLPPNEQMQRTPGRVFFFDANSATDNISAYYLNIITRTTDTAFVRLDGQPVPHDDPFELPLSTKPFRLIPDNPEYAYARVEVSQGVHKLESPYGFVAYIYGYGFYESYGYLAASLLQDLTFDFSFTTRCDSTSFTAIVPDYYKDVMTCNWNFGDGISSTEVNPTHAWTYPDTFNVRLIISTDSFSDTIIKKVIIPPDTLKADAGKDTLICRGDTVMLNGIISGANHIRWSPSEGLSDTTIMNPKASPSVSRMYYLTVTDTCNRIKIDSVEVRITDTLKAEAGNDTLICRGDTVRLNGNSKGAYRIRWRPAEGLSDTSIASPQASPLVSRKYYLTAIDMCNRTITDSVEVRVSDPLVTPQVYCETSGNSILFYWDRVSGSNGYYLTLDSGQVWNDTLISGADTFYRVENLDNPVTISIHIIPVGSFPCGDGEASADVYCEIVKQEPDKSCYLHIPSAFSPNDDGVNDLFRPLSNCSYKLQIFNRWGELVCEQSGMDEGWNGYCNKEPVQEGTYIYVLTQDAGDTPVQHAGTVILNR